MVYTIDKNNARIILSDGVYFDELQDKHNAEDYCRLMNLECNKKICDEDSISVKIEHLKFLFRELNLKENKQDRNEQARLCEKYLKVYIKELK